MINYEIHDQARPKLTTDASCSNIHLGQHMQINLTKTLTSDNPTKQQIYVPKLARISPILLRFSLLCIFASWNILGPSAEDTFASGLNPYSVHGLTEATQGRVKYRSLTGALRSGVRGRWALRLLGKGSVKMDEKMDEHIFFICAIAMVNCQSVWSSYCNLRTAHDGISQDEPMFTCQVC